METLIWIGIVICISQSAMFSGLNLALFSVSKLRLEIEISKGNPQAIPIAELRKDANFLLASILWGNVGVNVLLTLLSGSVLTGVSAFLFSTIVITIMGEIVPQAYLSRNAMRAAALFAPVIRFYQVLLFPLAKPTALVLNAWLGREAIQYVDEDDLVSLLKLQMDKEEETRLSRIESQGMINFTLLDEAKVSGMGQAFDRNSVVTLATQDGEIVFPESGSEAFETLLASIRQSRARWMPITDGSGVPRFVLNTQSLLCDLFDGGRANLADHCLAPHVFSDPEMSIVDGIRELRDEASAETGVERVHLYWVADERARRIITSHDFVDQISEGILFTADSLAGAAT